MWKETEIHIQNDYEGVRYILQLKQTLMPKSPHQTHQIRSLPELCDLQRFFYDQVHIPEQKVTPINFPFFNFVCYAIEMMSSYVKSSLQISFNVFLIDEHVRKYANPIQLYRRFIGFVQSWKKYADTDEGKLLVSFLQTQRNQKHTIKLFLRLRKILLKNLNQKILQEISLTHQDVVTIIHTLSMLTPSQRKQLTKKLNDHFIAKNAKYLNTVIMNAAVFCEYLISDLNDKKEERENYGSNLSNKITNILKNQQLSFIQEYNQEQPERYITNRIQEDEGTCDLEQQNPIQEVHTATMSNKNSCQSLNQTEESKKSLVDLARCMKELYILKEKDQEIDNRFKRFSKPRPELQ